MTTDEARALIESVLLGGEAGSRIYEGLALLLVQNSEAALAEIREIFVAEIAESMAGTLPEELAAAAAEAVAADTATLVTQMVEAQLKAIAEVIDAGVKAGKNPREIARLLEVVDGLDSQRAARLAKIAEYLESTGLDAETIAKRLDKAKQKLLRERRETIARTEARKITASVNEAEARARGAQFKRWITTGDDRVSDVCAANEAVGVIPVSQPFPNGERPPAHPNCRCTVAYLSDNPLLLQIARRRATEAIELTRQAREAAE